jgi:beta-galactosidase
LTTLNKVNTPSKHVSSLILRKWQLKDASKTALPGFNDSRWKLSEEPLQMGADGDLSANAWYRTSVTVAETGEYTLQFKNMRDRIVVFLDGNRIDGIEIPKKTIKLDLKAGVNHTLSIFAAHGGRNKQLFYVGPLDSVDAKGISGAVTLKNINGSTPGQIVKGWRMKGGPGNPNSNDGWTSKSPREGYPHFFRTEFHLPPLQDSKHIWRVITTSLSYGSVWVNGHNLGRYPEKIRINGLYIPENWLKKGKNTLVIYDENGVDPAAVSVRSEANAGRDVIIYNENIR